MKRQNKLLLSLTMALAIVANETLAQSLFGDPYGRYNRGFSAEMAMLRMFIMAISVGSGFCLGWFMSPQAKHLRRIILLCIAGLTVFLAIFNQGALGWSSTWLVSLVGFFVAVGYWIGTGVKALAEVPTTFGSSRWATIKDMVAKNLFEQGGIRLGTTTASKDEAAQEIRYSGDSHLLTVAPTRAGKGVSAIIPNLLSYTGSVLVIDPKGENALITAQARKDMGQAVQLVDPWGIAQVDGIPTARFNPLDWLVAGDVDITENAMLLADALIMPDGTSDKFWSEEAKALLQGIILYVATDGHEDGQRHLGRVRDLLLLDGEDLTKLFTLMSQSPHHVVASTGARSLQKEEKLLANVIASAQVETHFLDSARIRESLSVSDFKFEDLKTAAMSIYLVLPADRLHPFARWLRLLIQQSITVNARNIADKPEKPVLFILDEMPALGKLAVIEQAYGLMAGFGMQLWSFVQDLSQLERLYGKGWQSFIANTGMINYFGSTDRMTAEYFSALCGETTVWNFSSALSRAIGTSTGNGGLSSSETVTQSDTRAASQRKLAYPDELMRMNAKKQLVFIDNMYPMIVTKTPWFEDGDLKAKGVNLHDK